MKVLIFAGTKNGRELVEALVGKACEIVVSSISAYGDGLLPKGDNIQTIYGKMTLEDMMAFVKEQEIDLLIDSTHPYAQEVSKNLIITSKFNGIPLLCYERPTVIPEDIGLHFSSMEGVIDYLEKHKGNVLFTTGVNDMPNISRRLDVHRVFARVLPLKTSEERIAGTPLIKEQIMFKTPPFSVGDNLDHIDQFDIEYLVTKDSGKEGNIEEKMLAVNQRDTQLLVIDRPPLKHRRTFSELDKLLEYIDRLQKEKISQE